MYKTILVEKLIEDGLKLLEKLDGRGVPVTASAWFYDFDRSAWQLVIVTSLASKPGPLEAYMQIQAAMTGLDLSFALSDISVMSPQSRKFEEFKRTIEGAAGGARIKPQTPSEGTAFDDAYIYRWLT
ncbi:MAG: hypothetical protein WCE73_20745 [Candidatus Angelobacter sp.]